MLLAARGGAAAEAAREGSGGSCYFPWSSRAAVRPSASRFGRRFRRASPSLLGRRWSEEERSRVRGRGERARLNLEG